MIRLNEQEMDALGARLAAIFDIPVAETKGRWQLEGGDKSNRGVAGVFLRIVEELECGYAAATVYGGDEWREITQQDYDFQLGALPPEAISKDRLAFLNGEPQDHKGKDGTPRFACLKVDKLQDDGKPHYYRSLNAKTVEEFRRMFP